MASTSVFSPSFGNQPSKIVGRTTELREFEESLAQEPGSRDRAMLLIGQRGIGKTVLLLEMKARAAKAGFVAVKVTEGPSMLAEIIDLIQLTLTDKSRGEHERIHTKDSRLSGFGFSITGSGINVSFTHKNKQAVGFRVALSQLCDVLADQRLGVLLLIDEIQPNSEEMRMLAKTYQELIGESENIAIGMAGLPSTMSHILNEKTLTFLNRARQIKLGPISIQSVETYYSSVFKQLGYHLSDAQISLLARTTRGYPYLLQLIGYNIVNEINGELAVSDDSLEEIVSASVDELADTTFAPALAPLSSKDLEVLGAIATVSHNGKAKVSDTLSALHIENGKFQPYRKRLLDHGVISSPRTGELVFTIPYLAEYLQAETSSL